LVRDGRGESAGLRNRSVRGVLGTFWTLAALSQYERNSGIPRNNRGKRQALGDPFGQGSCKLPGSAFRDSLNRLPEKTIKLSTRQYTARLYTGGLDYADRLYRNMHSFGTRTTVVFYVWPVAPAGRTADQAGQRCADTTSAVAFSG